MKVTHPIPSRAQAPARAQVPSRAQAKIYGLLGYPIAHSLSPAMHNAAFEACKINAQYKLFAVKPEELNEFLDLSNLKSQQIFGFNVTMPHKERIIPYIEGSLDYAAKLTQTVNTVRVEACALEGKGRLQGFNTDGFGFYYHLTQELEFDCSGKRVAIIGAGGAAKAISIAMVKGVRSTHLTLPPPKSIFIYDRDKIKADKWVEKLTRETKACDIKSVDSIEGLDIGSRDLLLNASPVGMKEEDPCLIEPALLHANLLVYDLIYNPAETKLLKLAREKGVATSNGLKMLLHQGARSFKLWTGVEPPLEAMWQALCKNSTNKTYVHPSGVP